MERRRPQELFVFCHESFMGRLRGGICAAALPCGCECVTLGLLFCVLGMYVRNESELEPQRRGSPMLRRGARSQLWEVWDVWHKMASFEKGLFLDVFKRCARRDVQNTFLSLPM